MKFGDFLLNYCPKLIGTPGRLFLKGLDKIHIFSDLAQQFTRSGAGCRTFPLSITKKPAFYPGVIYTSVHW